MERQAPEVTAAVPSCATAESVLMVSPAHFGFNAETGTSNRFQRDDPSLAGCANERAVEESGALASALAAEGIDVIVVAEDPACGPCPDAVFPNNWLSLHPDGTVVLYPMMARSRRRERRLDVLRSVTGRGYGITRLVDLTHYETRATFLEGTGSVVFDHGARIAYACLSPRTSPGPLEDLCAQLAFRPCTFEATDTAGVPVYHTNVMLAIGTRFAVVAAEAIAERDREHVLASLADTGRRLESIDRRQMAGFAGNVLELRGADGATVLAMSARAAAAFGPAALARLSDVVDRVVAVPVPTIETLGGGSVRCMLAENFLPR